MPTYSYKCQQTGLIIERVMSMKQHSNTTLCQCGSSANQIILNAPITIIPQYMRYDFNGYDSPIDGRIIRNKRERIEDLARNECIEYDPGMKQDADRRVIEDEIKLDKAIDETVEREFEKMPLKKRELLAAELTAGATIETVRV